MVHIQVLVLSVLVVGCGGGLEEHRSASLELDVSPTGVTVQLHFDTGCPELPSGVRAVFDGQPMQIVKSGGATSGLFGDSCTFPELALETAINFSIPRPTSVFEIADGGEELRAEFQAIVGPHGLSGPLGSPPLTPGSDVELEVRPPTDTWRGAEKLHWSDFPTGPDDAPAKGTLAGRFRVKIPEAAVAGQQLTFSAGGTGNIHAGIVACDLARCSGRPMILPDGVAITVR